MKVPEDLRATLYDYIEAGYIVAEWFAEHELVDLTVCGPQCPAYQPYEWQMCCYAMSGWDIAPTGKPCPVLARRREQDGS